MSGEKIRLPDFLIADLYKSHLVDIGNLQMGKQKKIPATAKEMPGLTSTKKIDFVGENKKLVTVLVNQPELTHIADKDLQFLTSILKACALTISDIAIVNMARQKIDLKLIKEELQPRFLLLFAVDPNTIKLPFIAPPFQVQDFDGCKIMTSPALPDINQNSPESTSLKRLLWTGLKKMFNIA